MEQRAGSRRRGSTRPGAPCSGTGARTTNGKTRAAKRPVEDFAGFDRGFGLCRLVLERKI